MNEIKISFSEQEANALLQIIDAAIKSQGLQIAEAGSFLAAKIQEQAKAQLPAPAPEPAPEPELEVLPEGE